MRSVYEVDTSTRASHVNNMKQEPDDLDKLDPKRVSETPIKDPRLNAEDRLVFPLLATISFAIRFYKLPEPPRVVFDEVHVGGFVKDYFEGSFFVDVHPPLVKLLLFAIAKVLRWNGAFEFAEIGQLYDELVPYLAFRCVSAACGVATVIFTYAALRLSYCGVLASLLGASFVLFEGSFATLSRVFMLDSALLAFTSMTIFCFQRLQLQTPFGKKWWKYLVLTGVSLGLTILTKVSGIFTFIWIGLASAYHLFVYLGDLSLLPRTIVKHAATRLFAFVAIPLTMYCGFFAVHFSLLPYSGTGLGKVSPSFKNTFVDSTLHTMPEDISYGSTVTIRHRRLQQYLHSHPINYETGTQNQLVTMYAFDDDFNNEWVFETVGTSYEGKFDHKYKELRSGDYVKILHKATQKYLKVTDVRPPNSEHDYLYEVSCEGGRTNTQATDWEWKVKVVNHERSVQVQAAKLVIQLVHRGTGCTLMGQDVALPAWADHQNQVLCMVEPTPPNIMWYIEENSHPAMDKNASFPRISPPPIGLFGKLVDYHWAMYRVNSALGEPHEYSSLPHTWVLPLRGIAFFSNNALYKLTDEHESQIYYLGNILVHGAVLLFVLRFGMVFSLYVFKHMNPFETPPESELRVTHFSQAALYLLGWFVSYWPYFQMTRPLFAHHYAPALLFSILGHAQYTEYNIASRHRLAPLVALALIALAFVFFAKFHPLAYGLEWNREACVASRFLDSWDYHCTYPSAA